MPWIHVVKLTLAGDDIIAERKEQQARQVRDKATGSPAGGGWGRF